MAKRILALLAAIGLIVAAVLIRNGIDDDSSSDGPDTTDRPSGTVTVICSTELRDACEALDADDYDVTIEPAGDTLDRLSGAGAAGIDAWVTLDPFPAMVDEARRFGNLPAFEPSTAIVGSARPQLAVASAIRSGVAELCPGEITWRCAIDNGRKPVDGGQLIPGMSDPGTSADGLLAFANALASYFGSAQLSTASWEDPGFIGWLRNLKNRTSIVDRATTPLTQVILRRTIVSVGATTTAESVDNARPDAFAATDVQPAIPYNAVVATYGRGGTALVAELSASLVAAGWDAPVAPEPNLSPGTFIALRNLWED